MNIPHIALYAAGVLILVVQYWISRKGPVWIGGILPAVYAGFFIYGWLIGTFEGDSAFSIVLPLFGGIIILLSSWSSGWDAQKAQRKKELDKMRARDLT